MSDLISRQAAIDAMLALGLEDYEAYGAWIREGFDGERAAEAIRSIPSAQRWIPVSERLPEEEKLVLVYYEGYNGPMVSIASCDSRGWFDEMMECYGREGGVKAWMSLPETYQGDKDE